MVHLVGQVVVLLLVEVLLAVQELQVKVLVVLTQDQVLQVLVEVVQVVQVQQVLLVCQEMVV
jgi:hypothetical protein